MSGPVGHAQIAIAWRGADKSELISSRGPEKWSTASRRDSFRSGVEPGVKR